MIDRFPLRPAAGGWLEHRACVGMDPAIFYPPVGGNALTAKAVCASCPVRADCLRYALDNREHYGVWGGLTPKERRPRQKGVRFAVARCGTDSGYRSHRDRGEEPCGDCRDAHTIAARLRRHRLEVVR